eukprot:TRINITY_DN10617_c0_g1_i11.p1 TRINITY_DN10617_c0_g1~~TRINITY_DN10617_c0_g1_i11.p1  ORF type:complete len:395 (-),score=162.06 TRINITY_DN10617_c0_g1_i11:244-1404(-)
MDKKNEDAKLKEQNEDGSDKLEHGDGGGGSGKGNADAPSSEGKKESTPPTTAVETVDDSATAGGATKSKRYSDRRKEERLKKEREKQERLKKKVESTTEVEENTTIEKNTTPLSTDKNKDASIGAKTKDTGEVDPTVITLDEKDDEDIVAAVKKEVVDLEKESREEDEELERWKQERRAAKEKRDKDRAQRRKDAEGKKNKDQRPDMQIYRPGMGKFSSRTIKKESTASPRTSPEESREASPSKKEARDRGGVGGGCRDKRDKRSREDSGKSRDKHYNTRQYVSKTYKSKKSEDEKSKDEKSVTSEKDKTVSPDKDRSPNDIQTDPLFSGINSKEPTSVDNDKKESKPADGDSKGSEKDDTSGASDKLDSAMASLTINDEKAPSDQ